MPTPQTSIPVITQSSNEKAILKFILLKFDLKKSSKESQSFESPELVNELYDSFSSFFSKKQCYIALKKCSFNIQRAANRLIKEGKKNYEKKAKAPLSMTIIYETECTGNDFRQKLTLKPVVANSSSLLKPTNIYDSTWFV